jgi:hypothetical protein
MGAGLATVKINSHVAPREPWLHGPVRQVHRVCLRCFLTAAGNEAGFFVLQMIQKTELQLAQAEQKPPSQ